VVNRRTRQQWWTRKSILLLLSWPRIGPGVGDASARPLVAEPGSRTVTLCRPAVATEKPFLRPQESAPGLNTNCAVSFESWHTPALHVASRSACASQRAWAIHCNGCVARAVSPWPAAPFRRTSRTSGAHRRLRDQQLDFSASTPWRTARATRPADDAVRLFTAALERDPYARRPARSDAQSGRQRASRMKHAPFTITRTPSRSRGRSPSPHSNAL